MSYLNDVLLGVIEGITEFLPISSTGHLLLAEQVLGARSDAYNIVIQAGAMTSSGEVYVLDMGAPVRIIDLARNMIELSGLTVRDEANPDGDIEIKDVGLRPGEKLYEELLIGNNPTKTTHSRIMKAREHFIPWPQLSGNLDTLYAATRTGDVAQMRQMLKLLVPEFQPEQAPASGAA